MQKLGYLVAMASVMLVASANVASARTITLFFEIFDGDQASFEISTSMLPKGPYLSISGEISVWHEISGYAYVPDDIEPDEEGFVEASWDGLISGGGCIYDGECYDWNDSIYWSESLHPGEEASWTETRSFSFAGDWENFTVGHGDTTLLRLASGVFYGPSEFSDAAVQSKIEATLVAEVSAPITGSLLLVGLFGLGVRRRWAS